jgi:SAM-dependent methyltransferase
VLYENRSRAESFGAVAEQYDRARPSYPAALVDAVLTGGARDVLDVGCGTGISARLLAARGCAVLGVEVDPRMAELARASSVEVEVARFEQWRAGGRRFDLVTSAQAWHWIEPAAGAVRVAEALRAGGRLAVFWNFGDPPPQTRELLGPIYARLEPEIEKYSVLLGNHDARAQAAMTGIMDSSAFGPVETSTFPWRERYDTTGWLEYLATHSDHQALPPARRRRLFDAVGEAIDSIGGSLVMPYETVLVMARRAGSGKSHKAGI